MELAKAEYCEARREQIDMIHAHYDEMSLK